jgi:hypothetical protein
MRVRDWSEMFPREIKRGWFRSLRKIKGVWCWSSQLFSNYWAEELSSSSQTLTCKMYPICTTKYQVHIIKWLRHNFTLWKLHLLGGKLCTVDWIQWGFFFWGWSLGYKKIWLANLLLMSELIRSVKLKFASAAMVNIVWSCLPFFVGEVHPKQQLCKILNLRKSHISKTVRRRDLCLCSKCLEILHLLSTFYRTFKCRNNIVQVMKEK